MLQVVAMTRLRDTAGLKSDLSLISKKLATKDGTWGDVDVSKEALERAERLIWRCLHLINTNAVRK